jgi:hypothetical protein
MSLELGHMNPGIDFERLKRNRERERERDYSKKHDYISHADRQILMIKTNILTYANNTLTRIKDKSACFEA